MDTALVAVSVSVPVSGRKTSNEKYRLAEGSSVPSGPRSSSSSSSSPAAATAALLASFLLLPSPLVLPPPADAAVLTGSRALTVYFEAAAMIVTLILLGRLLEARAKGRSSQAIRRLVEKAL